MGTSHGDTTVDPQRIIEELRRERDEALAREAAAAEVLQVINASPGHLAPVFDAVLERAMRLCGAPLGHLMRYDGGRFATVALRGVPAAYAEIMSAPVSPSETGGSLAALVRGEKLVQVADMMVSDAYRAGNPARRALVDVAGGRTGIWVALRGDAAVLGALVLYRPEVRAFTDREITLLETFAAQAAIAMENARLINETREALAQQTATAEVLGVINSSPGDLTPVFEAMVDKARRLCDADSGHLALPLGDDFRTAVVSAMSPEMETAIRAVSYAPGRGTAVGRALMERQVVQIADIGADPEHAARHTARMGMIRTILGVPLLRQGEPIGAFGLSRSRVEPFTERQIELVRTFADQAVIAMENARLLTETRQRTAELQEALSYQTATGEVLRIVASSPDRLAPVFDAILDRAMELCDVKASNLYLHEDGTFTAVAARHPDPRYAAEMISNPVRPGPGTAIHRAFATRMPVHIQDIADDNAYGAGNPFRKRMVERGVRAVLIVPLVRGDEAIGAITIYRPVPEPYSEAQIELVRTFADQAVIAIENARLFGELRAARDAAEAAYRDLQTAQSSLVQAQKMAALGQLTAGIAHEIKNPLNFVNNFAGLSTELLDELKEDLAPALAGLTDDQREAIDETIAMLTGNLDKIAEHGRRADNIVKSMLEHSRGVSGEKRAVDLNALIDEALNLAYHGARAQDPSFNITLERAYAEALAPVELAPQEMTRVFLNLFGNGFYAAHKRVQADADGSYRPTLHIATRQTGTAVEITIRDNGTGIPAEIRDKLFQPFFTTKPTGEGTGLGLSISYDIVTQQHGGTIAVASEEGAYTEFTIRLPRE